MSGNYLSFRNFSCFGIDNEITSLNAKWDDK